MSLLLAAAQTPLADVVRRTAQRYRVESRALMVRTRQQLPRIATSGGRITLRRAEREIRFCALGLRADVLAAARHVPRGPLALADLTFAEIDQGRARPLLSRLHYLRSLRPDSTHLALLDPVSALPVAVCSLSALRWPRLERALLEQHGVPPAAVLDVSRVFAVDQAPANSISTLLSRVRTWVRQNRADISLLTTVVDPNLGFTGSSYRAANWRLWLSIRARPYLYHRRSFITPRQLRERFGTSNFGELQRRDPQAFERSRVPLQDSLLYCCRVTGTTEVVPPYQLVRLGR